MELATLSAERNVELPLLQAARYASRQSRVNKGQSMDGPVETAA